LALKAIYYISVRHSNFIGERTEYDKFINKIPSINTASGRNLFSEGGRKESYQTVIGIMASELI
jgi:hypothetical protein